MSTKWWPVLAWVTLTHCASPPSVPRPHEVASSTPRPRAIPSPCEVSEGYRARVAGLVSTGRIDRARRVLAHADGLCPANAAKSKVVRDELAALLDDPSADGELLLAEALSVEDPVAAQRLLDRARLALERAAGAPTVAVLPLLFGGAPEAMALDHAGRTLAITRGRFIALVDVASRREVRRLTASASVRSVSFSSAGALASRHEDGSLTIWEGHTGKVLHTLTGRQGEPVFAADGSSFATAGSSGEVSIVAVETGSTLKKLDAKHGEDSLMTFSRDGALLAVTHPDPGASTADVWDVASGTKKRSVPFQAGMGSVYPLFSPLGDVLQGVAGVGAWVTAAAVATGANVKRSGLFGAEPMTYFALALAPEGELALIGGPRLELWNAAQGKRLLELDGSEGWNDAAHGAFSGDGQRVAATVRGGSVRVWSVSTGVAVSTLEAAPEVRSVALSTTIATAATDGGLRIISPSSVREIAAHDVAFLVSLSPDGERLVSYGAGGTTLPYSVKLWDVPTGAGLHAPLEVGWSVDAVHFVAKSGAIQLASTYDVVVWEPSTGTRETKLQATQSRFPVRPAFSADGVWLAAPDSYRDVSVWDLSTEARMFKLDQGSQVTALALSRDDKRLATSAADNTVRVYDLTTTAGRELLRLHDASGPAGTLAFLDDDETLVGGVADALVFWSLADGAELARVPQASVRSLSARGRTLAWVTNAGGVRVATTDTTGPIAELVAAPGLSAAYVMMPTGFEVIGSAAEAALSHVRCVVGTEAYPYMLCRERLEQRGLLRALLRGEAPASGL